ncbi:MAG TPA: protein phosphatase 2C domain-containing protein [Alphaproteobacteria bacterium]|nr:protein phosphatase 2C domain-containing protein [Alphaproteobacteria bacterium]
MRRWEIGQAQSIGGRAEQQDRGEAFVLDDARTCLLVVADGMGGRAGGSAAAAAVIDCARVMMQQHVDARDLDGPALMRDIALSGHQTIRAMTPDPDSGPRATVTAFFAHGNEGHWVSVGDSRLYRFRGHELVERTKDQSLVQLLVDMGEIDEAEALKHPDRSVITGSLGGFDPPKLVTGEATLRHGDSIVLCTDGLWSHVEPQEMVDAAMADDLDTAAHALVTTAEARAGAGSDNVTLVMGRIKRGSKAWPWVN